MVKTLSCAGMAVLLAGAAITLSACDGGSASTAARDHTAAASGTTTVATATDSRDDLNAPEAADSTDARRAPVPLVDGKPMWAANRRHTAEENANYQFQRDGADFGARDLDDFVAKAHAFTASPPKDALTLTRSNGDRLLYDPAHNIFAVVTKDGAPRTMFKPQAGKTYWDQQVARQADDGDRSGERSYSRRSSDSASSDDQG
jgi:pyocin large subunit-like protein